MKEEQLPFNKYENYEYTKFFLKNDNDDDKSMFYYSYHDGLKPVYKNNALQVIDNNALLYQEMITMIRSAKQFIHFQTYIIRDGFFLRTIFCELAKKAKQGVKVRFLVD
jgi:cardiolipin synthase